jgi:hypothetical protein
MYKVKNYFPIIYGGICPVTAGKLVILYKNIIETYKDFTTILVFKDSIAELFEYHFVIPYSKFKNHADAFSKKYELMQTEIAIEKFCEDNKVPIFVKRSQKTNMSKCVFFPTKDYPVIPDSVKGRFGSFFSMEKSYDKHINCVCVGEESINLLIAAYMGNLCIAIGNIKSINSFRMMFPDTLAI